MIVCSACLAGMACKYNGATNNTDLRVIRLVEQGKAVPVCPEMLGGLSVPRIPCEILKEKVVNRNGEDKTEAFELGAKRALAIAQAIHASQAILMPRSPSCGMNQIYDGTFSKTLINGDGLFVRLLKKNGIEVLSPEKYFMEEELNE